MTTLPDLRQMAPTLSIEHLLLRECGSQPRELGELLRLAQARYPEHPALQARLTLSESVKTLWGRAVKQKYVCRHPNGYSLTRSGELHLDYLYETQVWKPHLKAIRRTLGEDAAAQAEQAYRA
ncbi:hypothetical protein [Deinococcus ruber]|uniref:Uncharacterized protein n=1 Tax=Deinococcus ruber TaxID=1848197 RepID=A0A918CBD8_9DEIO|nr:hypothetical protein [Deinococcus ruber]GGR16654.1 hypothetical protein GCM10008957_31620 [Deinococcus ruber]